MYHLIIRDKITGAVVKWCKMMKGISLHGKLSKFSNNKLHLYRNPILDLCCVLQYGSPNRFYNMKDV